MSRSLALLFDALYWVFLVLVYGLALVPALATFEALAATSLIGRAFALVAAYVVFLHAFVIALGLVKRLVQPRLVAGTSSVGANKHFIAWGLASIFQGIFLAAPFRDQVHFLFWLRYLHYRLHGMSLRLGDVIGTGVEIRQAELITLEKGVTIGVGASLSCHVNPDGKSHIQQPIHIGEGTLLGAHTTTGPGVRIGKGCVIGYRTVLTIGVTVEDGVRIGASCFVQSGVRIGENARVDHGTYVLADVPANARIAGVYRGVEAA